MQLQVTFRHVEPSDALKEYAAEKIGKIQKFLDHPIEASVTLSVEKHRQRADVLILAAGLKIRGSEITGDLYSALDLVTDKLERQVRRYRDKLTQYGRSPKGGEELPYKVEVFEADSFTEEPEPKVIHTQALTAKPMDVDEAAMQLDLSNDAFLVFTNTRSNLINVLYRRDDGHFGLIEPQ